MNRKQIIRAWKDTEYRSMLTEAELSSLPAHPAGMIELHETELGIVAGGEPEGTEWLYTFGCCFLSVLMRCGGTIAIDTRGCCKAVL